MDKATLHKITSAFLGFAKGIIEIEQAYLFGSFAYGNPSEESDIDIGIFVKTLNEDYLTVLNKLYQARRTIDSRIEPHIFISGYDPSGLAEEIMNSGLALPL